jgi:hypothetical protein
LSPSHAAKAGRRWRYYVSQAVLQGRKHEAGSVARVPALEIEARVAEAARAASSASNRQGWHGLHQPKASGLAASTDSPAVRPSDHDATLRAAIERVVMSRTTIEIELAEGVASDDQNRILIIPWTPPSARRRREIIQGEGERPSATRPMRTGSVHGRGVISGGIGGGKTRRSGSGAGVATAAGGLGWSCSTSH